MKCKKCDSEIKDGQEYCDECGCRVIDDAIYFKIFEEAERHVIL